MGKKSKKRLSEVGHSQTEAYNRGQLKPEEERKQAVQSLHWAGPVV